MQVTENRWQLVYTITGLQESFFNMKKFFQGRGKRMNIRTYIGQLPFAEYLSEEEKQLIEQYATIVPFTKGEVVHTKSQRECLGMVLVISGMLSVSMISDEGKQLLLYRLSPGETCVFTARCILNLLTYESVVEGEKSGSLLVIPKAALEQLLLNIRIENAMSKLAVQRCGQIMGALERVLFVRVDKRLVSLLLQESHRLGSREIHLTHEQLARDISSVREVVSRMLGKFAAEGLISLRRGAVIIENREGLRALLD